MMIEVSLWQQQQQQQQLEQEKEEEKREKEKEDGLRRLSASCLPDCLPGLEPEWPTS